MSIDEFKQAVQNVCVGKAYDSFPVAFKAFIANQFKAIDVNGMSVKRQSAVYCYVARECIISLILNSRRHSVDQ